MTTRSLKEFGAEWAPRFGLTPDEMYGRQRGLVDAKLLEGNRKPGPGGGARQNPKTVAFMLISLLCAQSRGETASRVPIYANLELSEAPEDLDFFSESLFENRKLFLTSLECLLSSHALASHVQDIILYRQEAYVSIKFKEDIGLKAGENVLNYGVRQNIVYPEILSRIPGSLIAEIAADINS